MLITRSVDGVPIRLTVERWSYICRRHPELKDQQEKVLETVNQPGLIQKGDFSAKMAIRFYEHTPLTEKHLMVVYREMDPTDGFVITAYFATELVKWREVLWRP
jgi:hypothetical protein